MWEQPGISNLLQIEALITDTPLQEVISTWAGEPNYGDLKKKVASSVSTALAEFQAKFAAIPDELIYDLFNAGEAYARTVSDEKLLKVQKALHLR